MLWSKKEKKVRAGAVLFCASLGYSNPARVENVNTACTRVSSRKAASDDVSLLKGGEGVSMMKSPLYEDVHAVVCVNIHVLVKGVVGNQ